jgi:enoyl-CoA hydratase
MAYDYLLLEIENNVATVTINRPPVNPLNSVVFKELGNVIDELDQNDDVRVIVLTGSGDRAFVAGADVGEMANASLPEVTTMNKVSRSAFSKIENSTKPVIAAINGLALGGGFELALACDLRISSEKAQFAFPEVGLGIIPGGGGTQRLQKIVGQGVAKELLFFGDMFGADRAYSLNIVNKVVAHDEVLSTAHEWATKLASKPPIALQMLKVAVDKGSNTDIETGLIIEGTCFGNVFASEDAKEGMTAFVEKRKPVFTGN